MERRAVVLNVSSAEWSALVTMASIGINLMRLLDGQGGIADIASLETALAVGVHSLGHLERNHTETGWNDMMQQLARIGSEVFPEAKSVSVVS